MALAFPTAYPARLSGNVRTPQPRPGEQAGGARRTLYNQSILDFAMEDAQQLNNRVGVNDQLAPGANPMALFTGSRREVHSAIGPARRRLTAPLSLILAE